MPEQIETIELLQLLSEHKYMTARSLLLEMNSVDLALLLEELPTEKALLLFRMLPKENEAEIFAELDSELQQKFIASITDYEISEMIDELFVDDAVSMLDEMPASLVMRVLANSSPETRQLMNQFLRYPENSAGSIMTAEFTDLSEEMTVEQAIAHIRAVGENKETIYTCYVIDEKRKLDGEVSVKNLLLAHDTKLVKEIMRPETISVLTTADQEEAVRLMQKYDLISLPVVDTEHRLVGIITVDDALDVMQEETTEDFEKMAAMAPSEKPYLKTSVFQLAKNRFPWLLILMVSSMLTGLILGHFEAVYAALPLLVTFMPMLTGTGGNAGSQASTMVIRGMAIGEISPRDAWLVFWKEARVSIIVGVILATVNLLRLMFFYPDSGMLPVVVAISQLGAVFLAKTIGGVLPMLAKALSIDPAIMAAPLITTIVDCVTLMLYFSIAQRLFL